MVKRIISFLNKEFAGVTEAALLLGVFAFISQLLGLFRDRALAHYFGPSITLDTYYAAFRIPDFLYVSIASLASVTVLIPFLTERLKRHNGEQEAHVFVNNVFTVFSGMLIIVSGALALAMPYLSHYLAPGFSPEAQATLVMTSRIMLISPIFLGISNMIGSITQIHKKFFVYALSPVCYNLGILIGIFLLRPTFGIYGVAYGVVIGAVLHLAIQLPVLIRYHFFPHIVRNIDWKGIRAVIALSLPRTLALSLSSFTMLILVSIASKLSEGSISIFNLASNLQGVPLGIIGASYAVAAFPTLVASYTEHSTERFNALIISATKQVIFLSLPVVVLFIVLRAQIVRVVLGSGSFSWTDTRLTAAALAVFAVSIVAQSLIQLFVRGYYASGNTRKPLLINLISQIIIVGLVYLMLYWFRTNLGFHFFVESILRVESLHGTEVIMVALGFTLGTILNFLLLWTLFKRDFLHNKPSGVSRTFYESLLGALAIGVVAYESLFIFARVFDINTFSGIFAQGFCAGIIGIVAGCAVLSILKNEELIQLRRAISNRFWKREVVAGEQKEL